MSLFLISCIESKPRDVQINLSVGQVSEQIVEGFDVNTLTAITGEDRLLPKNLKCFGYKFTGWKGSQTGRVISADNNGEYIVYNYDGSDTEFVAQWEIDSGTSIGPIYPVSPL